MHRDLAARNILITEDFTPKISDFGMSRVLGDTSKEGVTQAQIGPIKWMSPEAIKQTYSEKSDVWAWGVTWCALFPALIHRQLAHTSRHSWECLTGEEPFGNMDLMQLAVKIRDEQFTLEGLIPDHCPEYLRKLMLWCWQQKPADRPTFSQVVAFLNDNAPKGADRVHKVTSSAELIVKSPEDRATKKRWKTGSVAEKKPEILAKLHEMEASSDSLAEESSSDDSEMPPAQVGYVNFMADGEGEDAEEMKELGKGKEKASDSEKRNSE